MKKLLALFIFTILSPAYGSVLFEPYLGITTGGELEEDGEETLYQGTSYGIKFGFQYTYLFGGFDYRLARMAGDSKHSITKFEDDTLNGEQYFLFGGVDFPAPWRAWVGAGVGGKATVGDFEYTEGGGLLAGASYTGFPIVALNAEYVSWSYDDVDPGNSTDLEGSHFLFSLSLPINF